MRSSIVVDPRIHFGKPCIAGTRIPVENVLELVHCGIRPDIIRRDYYPDITPDDIQACILWESLNEHCGQ
ncbi:MAG: DUF433 domain-containing protein [Pirellulales bacterium]